MLMPQPFDRDTARAIRQDCEERKIAPTPAQKKKTMADLERAIISEAFERGDHKPDGTIAPDWDAVLHRREGMLRWAMLELDQLGRF